MKYLLAFLLLTLPAQAGEATVPQSEPVEVKQECLAPRSPTETQTAQQAPLCCCPVWGGGIRCSYTWLCFC